MEVGVEVEWLAGVTVGPWWWRGPSPRQCRRSSLRPVSVVALTKEGGRGVRPIAVGECLRRWLSRALTLHYAPEAARVLGHRQYAVGTKGGTDKIVHFARWLL